MEEVGTVFFRLMVRLSIQCPSSDVCFAVSSFISVIGLKNKILKKFPLDDYLLDYL